MTGKAEQGRAAAFEQALDRALDRHLPAALDRHLPAALDRYREVERLIRECVGERVRMGYPARDAAAWIEANYGKPPSGGADDEERRLNNNARINLWRWRTGQQEIATRDAIERAIRACGGDPHELPEELPPAEPPGAENEGANG